MIDFHRTQEDSELEDFFSQLLPESPPEFNGDYSSVQFVDDHLRLLILRFGVGDFFNAWEKRYPGTLDEMIARYRAAQP